MDLEIYTLKALSGIIIDPFFFGILVIIGIIFYWKNLRVAKMQKMILGESINSPLELTLSQFALGIIAGIILGFVCNFLGIIFRENSGIATLFIISIILMVIKPRFACYSYGASILGFISLLYKYVIMRGKTTNNLNIDIIMLVTFVGILHIIEGLLVIIDGSKGSIPVFSKKQGVVWGGYLLNRYWFLPISILVFVKQNTFCSISQKYINTPSWWPILRSPYTISLLSSSAILMMTFYGVFNYSGLTFTKNRREKRLEAGIIIIIYGIIITILGQIANLGLIFKILVLILLPILHETQIKVQRYRENKRKPIFYSLPGRICVIEVIPNSLSYKAGIRAGDIIKKINDKIVMSENEIYIMRDCIQRDVEITIIKKDKELKLKIDKDINKGLGILVVPVSILNKNNFGHVLKEKQNQIRKLDENKKIKNG